MRIESQVVVFNDARSDDGEDESGRLFEAYGLHDGQRNNNEMLYLPIKVAGLEH